MVHKPLAEQGYEVEWLIATPCPPMSWTLVSERTPAVACVWLPEGL